MNHPLSRLFALLGCLSLLLVSCQKESAPPPAPDTTATLRVPEMHCASCVGTIRAALRGIPGVDDTPVFDLEKREITIRWASSKVNQAAIEAAITNSGFKVGNEPATTPEAPDPAP